MRQSKQGAGRQISRAFRQQREASPLTGNFEARSHGGKNIWRFCLGSLADNFFCSDSGLVCESRACPSYSDRPTRSSTGESSAHPISGRPSGARALTRHTDRVAPTGGLLSAIHVNRMNNKCAGAKFFPLQSVALPQPTDSADHFVSVKHLN
jgi:hypothetical protein